ncbi:MAG: hypothetical protein ABJN98_06300 [Roseibium sp.]
MSRFFVSATFFVFGTILFLGIGNAASCQLLEQAFQADVCNEGEDGDCKRKILFNSSAIVFSEQMRVNTDGNIRSYSAKDPAGELCSNLEPNADPYKNGCAMNTICNGIRVVYKDGRVLRGVGDPEKKVEVDCPKLIREFNRIKKADWSPDDGSRVGWGTVIRTRSNKGPDVAKPCKTGHFMVSMASAMSGLPAKNRCDQAQYLDSDVPSVVVPLCWSQVYRTKNPSECKKYISNFEIHNVLPGDLAVVRRRDAPNQLIFAVVGDNGPVHKIGEASVGLHWRLKGRHGLPRTKNSMYKLDNKDLFDVIVFPGSRPKKIVITPDSYAEMKNASKRQFISWGGGKLSDGIARFSECSLAVRSN